MTREKRLSGTMRAIIPNSEDPSRLWKYSRSHWKYPLEQQAKGMPNPHAIAEDCAKIEEAVDDE